MSDKTQSPIRSIHGLIVEAFGYNYIVFYDNKRYSANIRSGNKKKVIYVVGDTVIGELINQTQILITALVPRTNLIYRSYAGKNKIIASNLTQLIIIIAIEPHFSINFLNRALVCAESQNIKPIIVINKDDLDGSLIFFNKIVDLYQDQLGYSVIKVSTADNHQLLNNYLINNKSLLIGQSGVGKSTIINNIIDGASSKTATINKAQTSGCHTTTHSSLYFLNNHISKKNINTDINDKKQYNQYIIDSPGLHEFGLSHLLISDIIQYFPECRNFINKCKFRNCQHLNEPNCAITNAVTTHHITQTRYDLLQLLIKQTKQFIIHNFVN